MTPSSASSAPFAPQDQCIKWGYATQVVPNLPRCESELSGRLSIDGAPPQPNDVMVAQVTSIGRHSRIENHDRRPMRLYQSDLVGVVFGHRYATNQFEARVPDRLDMCHLIVNGGVCGEVTGIPSGMASPTRLRPLGFLLDSNGRRVNATDHGIAPVDFDWAPIPTIVVVGSSMDSGKTTAACSVIGGLTRAGARVCAGKITGTASAKDPLGMRDAGAIKVLDFTDAGYGSTAKLDRDQLCRLADAMKSHLAVKRPDYLVLEIADGINQRETGILLDRFSQTGFASSMIYTCNDSVGVRPGVDRLRGAGFHVAAVSGIVSASSLGVREASAQTDVPVLTANELQGREIIDIFRSVASPRLRTTATTELSA